MADSIKSFDVNRARTDSFKGAPDLEVGGNEDSLALGIEENQPISFEKIFETKLESLGKTDEFHRISQLNDCVETAIKSFDIEEAQKKSSVFVGQPAHGSLTADKFDLDNSDLYPGASITTPSL